MIGDSTRFTRQDGVEEAWRIMQPLLDAPPRSTRTHPDRGDPRQRQARRRPRTLARPLGDLVTAVEPDNERKPQSAAAPSPFPPIASYAFLSNCHTGALVAPDGAIDWLCVPRFDSPSVFGSLLDREAGFFRFAPFGINHPTAVVYEPGTNVLETTWKTPNGWIVVRDALTMSPREHEDTITPHTRPPADDDADHMLVRTVECVEGRWRSSSSASPPSTTDARLRNGRWSETTGTPPMRPAPVRRSACRPAWPSGSRRTGFGRATCSRRESGPTAPSRGTRASSSPQDVDEADSRIAATTRFWRAWLGRARIPDHRFRDPVQRSALTIKGLTYMPTGATVAALTTSLPETPGGERNWDYRYTWIRDTTFTLQALHMLNLDWEADEFMQFVADVEATEDGSLQIMYGIDGRRDLTESTRDEMTGYAGAQSGADRQRRLRSAAERCLRRRARLDPAAHAPQPAAAAPALADRADPGRVRDARSGASPTRESGKRGASRSTTCLRS